MKLIHNLLACGMVAFCAVATAQSGSSAAAVADDASQSLPQQSDTAQAAPPEQRVPQVRIVRLSQVAGQVYMDRKTEQHFETAFVNLPIVAGSALLTRKGLAEVEFEDNSSLRLTPDSLVDFPLLGRDATGTTTTAVLVRRGTVYVSLAGGKNAGAFTISVGDQTIALAPGTHLRIDIAQPTAQLVVYQGSAAVSGPWGSMAVPKRRAVSFALAASSTPQVVRPGEEAAFDAWDKNAAEFHKNRAATASAFAGSPYSYGVSDLGYYGSFANVGGCGVMWRPYLANAAWDPYGSGVWTWYPGQGYTWVSLYPWGWMPFHSGQWDFCPTGGWGWRPNGNWNGLSNHPVLPLRTTGHNPVHKWPVAPEPPRPGRPTMVAVNVKSMEHSQLGGDGRFVLRADSAGLGVPRGVFNNFGKIAERAETRGTAVASLSDRQMQAGLMAPSRSADAAPGLSGISGVRSSGANPATSTSSAGRSTSSRSTASSASSSFASSGSRASMPSSTAAASSSASPHK